MKIRVLKIGKPADQAYAQLVDKFERRLKSFLKMESLIIKAHEGTERSLKELLGRLQLEDGKRDPCHFLICLDERGKILSSPKMAELVSDNMGDSRIKQMSFVIGGPYGLPPELVELSDLTWSLSHAVFPSDMAWLMVWEQLYRASTIIKGSSYHHS